MKIQRLIMLLFCWLTLNTSAQDYTGLSFLQIGLGARQAGLGKSHTGLIDDAYTMFYNPGGMGFSRRWQVSAGYDKWIADTRLVSLLAVRQFEVLGSKKSTVGVGLISFGGPDWDSTNGARASVSAGSTVGVLSLAQRLDWISWPTRNLGKHISLGATLKGVHSNFAGYTTMGANADVGVMVRSGRYPLDWWKFKYWELILGYARQNYSLKSFRFDQHSTHMPTCKGFGASLNMGEHHGFSCHISFDAKTFQDRNTIHSAGAEVWWKNLIGLRFGYEFERDYGSGFTMGAGLRLGGNTITDHLIPGKNTEFKLDFANSGYGDILDATYRGAPTVFPGGPEPFARIIPAHGQEYVIPKIDFQWEESEDPDPWDELTYYLLIDPDSIKVERAAITAGLNFEQFLNTYEPQTDADKALRLRATGDQLLVCYQTRETSYGPLDLTKDNSVPYFWAVLAVDLDNHVETAHGSPDVGKYIILRPNVTVSDIFLNPIKKITPRTDGRQGHICVVVENNGKSTTPPSMLSVFYERYPMGSNMRDLEQRLRAKKASFCTMSVDSLQVDEKDTLCCKIDWNVPQAEWGRFLFYGRCAPQDTTGGWKHNEAHDHFGIIYTIPKWNEEVVAIPTEPVFNVRTTQYDYIQIPVLPWVFFDVNDTQVHKDYTDTSAYLGANLPVIARRLIDYQESGEPGKLRLTGYVHSSDQLSSEEDKAQLAVSRAEAVRDVLVKMGVKESRIIFTRPNDYEKLDDSPGREKIAKDATDPREKAWIDHENRRVLMAVDAHDQATRDQMEWDIFAPDAFKVTRSVESRHPYFRADLTCYAPQVESCLITILDESFNVLTVLPINVAEPKNERTLIRIDSLAWDYARGFRYEHVNKPLYCCLKVSESLSPLGTDSPEQLRTFFTDTLRFSVRESQAIVLQSIFNIYHFEQAVSISKTVYGQRLFQPVLRTLEAHTEQKDVFISFEGHTCTIGPDSAVNDPLSVSRAERLKDLLRTANTTSPAIDKIIGDDTMNNTIGYSEHIPLKITIRKQGRTEEILLGDMEKPLGRNYNRRAEIKIIRELGEKK